MWRKIGEKSNAAAVARIKKQTSLLLAIRAECARAGVIVSDYYYAYQWEHRSQDQWEHRSHRAPVHLRTRASQRHTGAKKNYSQLQMWLVSRLVLAPSALAGCGRHQARRPAFSSCHPT